jgi:hypothetical protein
VEDATNGRGVDGVTVAAIWHLQGGPVESMTILPIAVAEVRTSGGGYFRVGMGRPRIHFGWGRLLPGQPTLIVLDPRYVPRAYSHSEWNDARMRVQSKPWPAIISLEPIRSQSSLAGQLADVRQHLLLVMTGADECQWAALRSAQVLLFERYGHNPRGGVEGGPVRSSGRIEGMPCP